MRKDRFSELNRYINELKWIRNEIVKKDKTFVTIIPQKFELNNKKTIYREQILKNNIDGSAVIIVPVLKNGEYIVTIEPRVFTSKRIAVGFPAGYIEKGEKPENAALRELREETGYVTNKLTLLDSFYQDEGVSAAYNHIFLAENCERKFNQKLDPDEIVRYMPFRFEELLELEKKGYISGSNAKLALCRIKERR
jgi:ADP-ribose pyrophosphatase